MAGVTIGLDQLVTVALVAGAAGVGFWRGSAPYRKMARTIGDFIEDWNGVRDRPGVPGRLGVMERLENHDVMLTALAGELRYNGGGSTKDAVRRIETTQRVLKHSLEELSAVVRGGVVVLPTAAPDPSNGQLRQELTP